MKQSSQYSDTHSCSHKFDSQIRNIDFKGKELLFKSLPKNKTYYFLPSHTNKKYRNKIKVQTKKDGPLELVLGKTVEKKENGQFITFYELEGEGQLQEIEKEPNVISHFCKKVKGLLKSNKSKVKKRNCYHWRYVNKP